MVAMTVAAVTDGLKCYWCWLGGVGSLFILKLPTAAKTVKDKHDD